MQLTRVDKRILRTLLFEGFSNFSDLSRVLRLSPSTVMYSIRKLMSEGVILQYRIRLNPVAIGFRYPVLFMIEPKLARYTDFIRDELINFPYMNSVSIVTGDTDIIGFAYFKDYIEMGQGTDLILKRLGDKIRKMSAIPITDVLKLHQKPVIRNIPVKLDETDYNILSLLVRNPMMNIISVAETLGRSRNLVARRVKRMYDEQVILKRSVKVDLSVLSDLGIGCWAMIFLDTYPETRSALIRELSNMESVHELFGLGTTHNYLAVIRSTTVNSLSHFVRYLLDRDLVSMTRSNVILSFVEKEIEPELVVHG